MWKLCPSSDPLASHGYGSRFYSSERIQSECTQRFRFLAAYELDHDQTNVYQGITESTLIHSVHHFKDHDRIKVLLLALLSDFGTYAESICVVVIPRCASLYDIAIIRI